MPASVLTKCWSQVMPYSKQQSSVSIIGAGRALGLLASGLIVLATLDTDVKWVSKERLFKELGIMKSHFP